ncbi:MAG: hypothetical protein E5V22_00010 [Mesorhizobium sp.]|nr:MAG: hypothetical protein E5V22_00010 [Mesorhizobium sp.]
MSAAISQQDWQAEKGIRLRADNTGHIVKFNSVETKLRIVLNRPNYVFPEAAELPRFHVIAKIYRQDGRIIIAQFRSKPDQPADQTMAFDCQWQNKNRHAGIVETQHDHRNQFLFGTDVAIPFHLPIKQLEYSTIRMLL